MNKKNIFLVSVILMFAMVSTTFAQTFSDMQATNWAWAKDYVDKMATKAIVTGYEDGSFKPEKSVSKQEAIALFARILGCNDPANSEIVDKAVSIYSNDLSQYKTYATREISFLLYRGALRTTELPNYLLEKVKDEPLKRYEAAVLITKAMGAEDTVKSSILVALDFSDVADIPMDYRSYVRYVNDQKIMQGMGDNKFSPLTDVLRSQIAVMLCKIDEKINLTYTKAMLTAIDANMDVITIKDDTGASNQFGFDDNAKMWVEGALTQHQNMPIAVPVVVTFSNGVVKYVDAMSSIPDATVNIVFMGYSTEAGVLTINGHTNDGVSSDVKSYKASDAIAFRYDNSPATIMSFKTGDIVSLDIKSGKVAVMSGKPKTIVANDITISDIVLMPKFSVKISSADKEYDGKIVEVSDSVNVKRNGSMTDLRALLVGDSGTITFNYDKVTVIDVISMQTNVSGVIEEIVISAVNPSLKVNVGGTTKDYALSRDMNIMLDSKIATLYDLRLGYNATLTIDGQTIKTVNVKSVASPTQMTGVIENVNASYGFFVIDITDSTGNIRKETVFAKNTVTVIDSASGTMKRFTDLKAGQSIIVTGAVKNAAFEATTIVIVG